MYSFSVFQGLQRELGLRQEYEDAFFITSWAAS
jgi:hypothetical protein